MQISKKFYFHVEFRVNPLPGPASASVSLSIVLAPHYECPQTSAPVDKGGRGGGGEGEEEEGEKFKQLRRARC